MFNPNDHLSKLRGKNGDYLEVKWRLVWFRDKCERGEIVTELVHFDMDKGIAVFKAKVTDGQGGIATGHGSETAKDFGDYLEKAETKAIGRALAALGYGTQFAPELEEGDRIVDSPVPRAPKPAAQPKPDKPLLNGDGTPAFPEQKPAQRVTIEQHTLRSLYDLGKSQGLWSDTSTSKFYAFASAVADRPQSKVNWDMNLDEMGEMAKQIYEQVPATVTGAN